MYGIGLSFQVEKVNTVVNSSIVYIVEGWFSFLSWEGTLINRIPKVVSLKTHFQVEKVNTVINISIVYIVKGWFSFHSERETPD